MQENKDVEKINSSINILDLVKEFNIAVEKRGKNYFALCPFHEEKTPSFSISVDKNIAVCMGCHKGGAPFSFYKELKKLTYEQTLLELSQKYNISVDYKPNSKNTKYKRYYELMKNAYELYQYILFNTKQGKPYLDYLMNERNLTKETILKFNIGCIFKSKNFLTSTLINNGFEKETLLNTKMTKENLEDSFSDRIMFPIFDIYKNCVAFSGRIISKDSNEHKYINSSESAIFKKSSVIYNLDNALVDNNEKEVILVEGFFDVIALYNIGFNNLIATMGTALTYEHIKILEGKVNTLTLLFDGDKAGIKATYEAIEKLKSSSLNVNICILKEGLDPDEYIKKYGKDEFTKLLNQKIDMYTFLYNNLEQKYNLENNNELTNFIEKIETEFSKANPIIKNKYKNIIKEKFGYNLEYKRNNKNKKNNFFDKEEKLDYDSSELDYVYQIDEADYSKISLDLEPIEYTSDYQNNKDYNFDPSELPTKYEESVNTSSENNLNRFINGRFLLYRKYDDALETLLIYLINKKVFLKEEEKDIFEVNVYNLIQLNKENLDLFNNIKYFLLERDKFDLEKYQEDLILNNKQQISTYLNNIVKKAEGIKLISSEKDFKQAIHQSIECLKEYDRLIEKVISAKVLLDESGTKKYLKRLNELDKEKR